VGVVVFWGEGKVEGLEETLVGAPGVAKL